MAIAHLAADEDKMVKTGRILKTSQLAKEYGFVDLVGLIFLYNLLLLLSPSKWYENSPVQQLDTVTTLKIYRLSSFLRIGHLLDNEFWVELKTLALLEFFPNYQIILVAF